MTVQYPSKALYTILIILFHPSHREYRKTFEPQHFLLSIFFPTKKSIENLLWTHYQSDLRQIIPLDNLKKKKYQLFMYPKVAQISGKVLQIPEEFMSFPIYWIFIAAQTRRFIQNKFVLPHIQIIPMLSEL